MRTNIEIDDELLARATEAGHFRTKKETVAAALQLLIEQEIWRQFHEARGAGVFWDGYDYKAMRMAD